MKTTLTSTLILFLLLLSCSGEDPELIALENAHDVVLPAKSVVAEVMGFDISDEMEDLILQLGQAMKEKPLWAMAYMAEHSEPGEVVPYHENFGITEQEYQGLLAGFWSLRKKKVAEVDLWFESIGDNKIRVHSRELKDLLGLVEIDFANNFANTPHGKADQQDWAGHEADAESRNYPFGLKPPMGKWKGIRWKKPIGIIGALAGSQVNVALGKQEDGRGVFHYRVRNSDKLDGMEALELYLVYGDPE